MEIVSCNFQQKTELTIKIDLLDLIELKQDKNDIIYLPV